MAQDFAKQRNNPDGNKRKRSASKPPMSGNANWSWYFSGAVAGNTAPATTSTTAEAPTAAPELASAEEQRPVLYLWQVGSFQSREDAESLRARIILMNMNVTVSQGVVGGRTFYRVQVGPIAGRQNAQAARDILSGNGIDSMLLQLP